MFDPILYWNEAVLEANARDHTTPPAPGLPKRVDTRGPTGSSWAFALVHLAMYDAVVAVSGTKTPYTGVAYAGPATSTARDAAVATAAQCVMQALWPARLIMMRSAISADRRATVAGPPSRP